MSITPRSSKSKGKLCAVYHCLPLDLVERRVLDVLGENTPSAKYRVLDLKDAITSCFEQYLNLMANGTPDVVLLDLTVDDKLSWSAGPDSVDAPNKTNTGTRERGRTGMMVHTFIFGQ